MYNKKLNEVCPDAYTEDLSLVMDMWIDKVNAITSNQIVNGFACIIHGTEYWFKYDLVAQTNLANARADALTSIQLGLLDNKQQVSVYGVSTDGSIDYDKQPTDTPDTWRKEWNGYVDGVKHTLVLTALEILKLAKNGDDHVAAKKKASVDKYIVPLYNCSSISELNALAVKLHIDSDYISINSYS